MRTVAAVMTVSAALGAVGCSSSHGNDGVPATPPPGVIPADAAQDDAKVSSLDAKVSSLDATIAPTSDGSPAETGATPGEGGTAAFVHPGLLHTLADLDRMRTKVTAEASPWIDGWNKLVANNHASLDWTPNPQPEIHRNDGTNADNYIIFDNDVAAAYACALRWEISGDDRYADKSVQILNAWSSTLTKITTSDGHYDGLLVAGIQGYQIANAAEIMRTYAKWARADFARFQSMMLNVFYPMVSGISTGPSSLLVYSNWDLAAMAAMAAIGILCDDRTKFDAAVAYFKSGLGNGAIAQVVYYVHPGHLGQTQESGRDQGHDTLSISLLTSLCEMAWHQGVDLYGYDNSRVLAAAEYVAKGNLIAGGTTYYSVPFARYTNGGVLDTAFSVAAQGTVRPEWSLIYHHYVNRMGLATPYTQRFMQATQPEGGGGDYGPNSGGYDQLGYGTLTFSRDPIAAGAAPSGLTAYTSQGTATLSWWGGAYASGYTVKRATASGGPYTAIATGIIDPLTYTDTPSPAGVYYYLVTGATPSGESAPSSAVKAVTATQLDTYLPFDSEAGVGAHDVSGNAHDAILMNGASWAPGKSGNAASLDGKGAFVALPDDVMGDMADFTIAASVYWKTASTFTRIFDFGDGTGHYMMLTPRSSAGGIRFAITVNLAVGEQIVDGPAALPTGQWVKVAVTLAGTVATLYVNGVAVGSNGSVELAPFRLGHTFQNWVGRSQYASDPTFDGLIDDLRIYRGALSAAEIAAL